MYCLKGGGVLLEKIDGNYSLRYRTTLGSTGGRGVQRKVQVLDSSAAAKGED